MLFKRWWNGDAAKAALIAAGTEAIMQAAEFMADHARANCPVDTGELLGSIQVVSSKGGSVVNVVATADYAQWVEFGHMAGSTFVAPNPFMRNALAATAAQFPTIAAGVRLDRPGGASNASSLGSTFMT